MSKGRLYLIPVPLGQTAVTLVLPQPVIARAQALGHFVAENARSARAFLKALPATLPLQQIEIAELNKHTATSTLPQLLAPLLAGHDVGLISEAGCPAVADPGATLVALAHQAAIEVVPMVGPSSILLALMASGLTGQGFAFHGYLPSDPRERERRLRELENESRQAQRTQIFIETPYRNRQMLESMLKACAPETRLCVASDLTLASERITTRPVSAWRRQPLPEINRRPTVFLLQA
ncbi:MAG: SAM-dependent methyltransferase [Candidatus Accumulibacter sp.]|uniref:SAM-dependent methyltransferase n=1 Tax=Accumulibacter sp. TaxID=2053492 RepID=UPI0025FE56F5|nr:SAM-dependent methyltransferase [Accumulibacter sp.]MCP5248537.1 SAM-dependent methyltransferase [Accumulibacter sp.]